jgi:hypothetical protein
MNPPIVYEETRPRSQRTIRIIAIVPSMIELLSVKLKLRETSPHRSTFL